MPEQTVYRPKKAVMECSTVVSANENKKNKEIFSVGGNYLYIDKENNAHYVWPQLAKYSKNIREQDEKVSAASLPDYLVNDRLPSQCNSEVIKKTRNVLQLASKCSSQNIREQAEKVRAYFADYLVHEPNEPNELINNDYFLGFGITLGVVAALIFASFVAASNPISAGLVLWVIMAGLTIVVGTPLMLSFIIEPVTSVYCMFAHRLAYMKLTSAIKDLQTLLIEEVWNGIYGLASDKDTLTNSISVASDSNPKDHRSISASALTNEGLFKKNPSRLYPDISGLLQESCENNQTTPKGIDSGIELQVLRLTTAYTA